MKKFFTLLAFAAFLAVQAQQDVYLRILHTMNGDPFAYNQTTSNNLGNNLQFSRLQYYISDITLTHDGGQTTDVTDTWLLISAGAPTEVLLGQFSISTLEQVTFHIGVGPDKNHEDPSLYPASHPLAPQFPSMHWGWSAGYRFVALEGLAGASMSDALEVHALGDANFFSQTHATAGVAVNGDLIIQLDADYPRALDNIDVSGGLIYHGMSNEGTQLLELFRDSVFTVSSAPASGIGINVGESLSFSFGPNPTPAGGKTTLRFTRPFSGNVKVVDLLGREVLKRSLKNSAQTEITLHHSGIYLVMVSNSAGTVTRRITVQ